MILHYKNINDSPQISIVIFFNLPNVSNKYNDCEKFLLKKKIIKPINLLLDIMHLFGCHLLLLFPFCLHSHQY